MAVGSSRKASWSVLGPLLSWREGACPCVGAAGLAHAVASSAKLAMLSAAVCTWRRIRSRPVFMLLRHLFHRTACEPLATSPPHQRRGGVVSNLARGRRDVNHRAAPIEWSQQCRYVEETVWSILSYGFLAALRNDNQPGCHSDGAKRRGIRSPTRMSFRR